MAISHNSFFITDHTVTGEPASLTAVISESNSTHVDIAVSWESPGDPVTDGYIIYYQPEGGPVISDSVFGRDTDTHSLDGLQRGVTYYISLVALSPHLPSPLVGPITVITGESLTSPSSQVRSEALLLCLFKQILVKPLPPALRPPRILFPASRQLHLLLPAPRPCPSLLPLLREPCHPLLPLHREPCHPLLPALREPCHPLLPALREPCHVLLPALREPCHVLLPALREPCHPLLPALREPCHPLLPLLREPCHPLLPLLREP